MGDSSHANIYSSYNCPVFLNLKRLWATAPQGGQLSVPEPQEAVGYCTLRLCFVSTMFPFIP